MKKKEFNFKPQLYIITDSLVSECSRTAACLSEALAAADEMVEFRRAFIKEEDLVHNEEAHGGHIDDEATNKWLDSLGIECTIVSRGTETRRVHLID